MEKKMKKLFTMVVLGLVLAIALGAPAMAQAMGVWVDGKSYTFTGNQPYYEADGMKFIPEGNTVRIQEPGKEDRVLPLEQSLDTSVVQDGAGPVASSSDTAYISEDASHAFASNETSLVQAMEGYDAADNRARFDQYAKYGLAYDAKQRALFYNGQKVRVFEDAYPLGDFGYSSAEHFDPTGVIDITAKRDLTAIRYNADGSHDPSGTLIGLNVLSQEEFARRDLTEWISPKQNMAIADSSGEPMSAEEMRAFYAPYAEYGLSYDRQTDRLSYEGKTVRSFLDVMSTNGESFSGGHFRGSMTSMNFDEGEIDVTILRDYDSPDAEGNGKIIGVRAETAK